MSKATPSIDRHNFFILHDRKLDDAFCQAMGLKSYHSKFDEPSNRFCTMICTVKGSSERDLHTLLTRYVEKTPEPRVKLFPFQSAQIFETNLRSGPPHPIFEDIMKAKYLEPELFHEWGSFDTTPETSPKKRPAAEMSGGAWPSNQQPVEPLRALARLASAVQPTPLAPACRPSAPPPAPPPLHLSSPPRRPSMSSAPMPKRPHVVCSSAPQPTLAINCYDMLRLQDDYIQALHGSLRSKDQTIAAQAKLLSFLASKGK